MFCLYYDAKTKTVRGLNGSGRAPKNLKLEDMKSKGYYQIPASDVNSATVPGAAAGWIDTVERFGSGKVTLQQILQPAIDLAENGFPVHPISAVMWQQAAEKLRGGKDEWLIDGKAPAVAQIVSVPTLAQTYRLLGEKGMDGFYRGEVAQAIVDVVKEFGGVMSLQDLAEHRSTPTEPIYVDYKGVRLWEHAPNGQGIIARVYLSSSLARNEAATEPACPRSLFEVIALGILDQLERSGRIPPIATMTNNTAEYLHVLIETLRFAFADASQHVTDPEFYKVPVEKLLSEDHFKARAALFRSDRAATDVKPGFAPFSGDTVYFSVVDKDGNACSFINSVFTSFGCGAVARGTGVILQNRGSNFFIDPSHPNRLEGGKRPYHTIIPAMATIAETGDLYLCFG